MLRHRSAATPKLVYVQRPFVHSCVDCVIEKGRVNRSNVLEILHEFGFGEIICKFL